MSIYSNRRELLTLFFIFFKKVTEGRLNYEYCMLMHDETEVGSSSTLTARMVLVISLTSNFVFLKKKKIKAHMKKLLEIQHRYERTGKK